MSQKKAGEQSTGRRAVAPDEAGPHHLGPGPVNG